MIPILLLLALGAASVAYVIVGMTRNDLWEIKTKRIVNERPNSRALRKRPPVGAVIKGHATQECSHSIRTNKYKKLTTFHAGNSNAETLLLRLDSSTKLEARSVLEAVKQLAVGHHRQTINITPLLVMGRDSLSLLKTYATLARLPFAQARAGFNIPSDFSVSTQTVSGRSFDYAVRAVKLMNAVLFVYACYSAAHFQQPEMLLIYVVSLASWITWSVVRYPYFSAVKKLSLLLLSPVSYVYFVHLALTSPFETPYHSRASNLTGAQAGP